MKSMKFFRGYECLELTIVLDNYKAKIQTVKNIHKNLSKIKNKDEHFDTIPGILNSYLVQ